MRTPPSSKRSRVTKRAVRTGAAVTAVATAHISYLHYFLRFLDFAATWRTVTEVTRGISEYINLFGIVAAFVLPAAIVSVLVYQFVAHDSEQESK